ncbi:hypothetical protein [Thiobacillus denitrificans]|uniref:hypothetical protein n=1 Tax=Thiobacillus denitrificans TaxID=36861 RepID=UPI00039DC292|nr:hypothetical protein [Thiobacillus denitrificans]
MKTRLKTIKQLTAFSVLCLAGMVPGFAQASQTTLAIEQAMEQDQREARKRGEESLRYPPVKPHEFKPDTESDAERRKALENEQDRR